MKISANKGFENLIGSHTKALEDNSKGLVEILEILSQKSLDKQSLAQIKEIKKELKSIDKRLDRLGEEPKLGDDFYGI